MCNISLDQIISRTCIIKSTFSSTCVFEQHKVVKYSDKTIWHDVNQQVQSEWDIPVERRTSIQCSIFLVSCSFDTSLAGQGIKKYKKCWWYRMEGNLFVNHCIQSHLDSSFNPSFTEVVSVFVLLMIYGSVIHLMHGWLQKSWFKRLRCDRWESSGFFKHHLTVFTSRSGVV